MFANIDFVTINVWDVCNWIGQTLSNFTNFEMLDVNVYKC